MMVLRMVAMSLMVMTVVMFAARPMLMVCFFSVIGLVMFVIAVRSMLMVFACFVFMVFVAFFVGLIATVFVLVWAFLMLLLFGKSIEVEFLQYGSYSFQSVRLEIGFGEERKQSNRRF